MQKILNVLAFLSELYQDVKAYFLKQEASQNAKNAQAATVLERKQEADEAKLAARTDPDTRDKLRSEILRD